MGADRVGVLEATYASADDDRAWGQRLLEALTPMLGAPQPLNILGLEHSADCTRGSATMAIGPLAERFGPMIQDWLTLGGPSAFRQAYYPSTIVATIRTVLAQMPSTPRATVSEMLWTSLPDAKDVLGLVVHPDPGLAVVLCVPYDRELRLSRQQRKLLTQVALHFETGCRLRRRPDAIKAVLSSEGRLLHREIGCPDSERMTAHVKQVERARTRRVRREPEAIDLWRGLIAGSASVIERSQGSRREYLVVENAPASQPLRALTPGELDVVSFSARGLSAKMVAYALGLSEPTVSSRLASAASKIGVATRIELVRLAAMLTRDPRARFEHTALTTAEHEVLALLAQGLSNSAIAAFRSRSLRTIANQVAALLRKTHSDSRRALVARS